MDGSGAAGGPLTNVWIVDVDVVVDLDVSVDLDVDGDVDERL